MTERLPDAAVPQASAAVPPSVGPAVGAKSSVWSLRLRIASGVLFLPVLILVAQTGGLAFLAFVGVQVLAGLYEFYRMARTKGLEPSALLGSAAGVGMVVLAYQPQFGQRDVLTTAALLLPLGLALRQPTRPLRLESVAVTAFGVLWVGWLSAHLVLLRELPWIAGTEYAQGASYVFLVFLTTWGCDTGAYVFGRMFGRNRPWTTISPRKSVEGSIGGFVCAGLAAFAARAWFAPFLSVVDALVLGALVGVFAQVGDLVESLFKRDARQGDSSDLIPGHGGVLDRFDSLYFAAPIVYYYLKLAVFRVP